MLSKINSAKCWDESIWTEDQAELAFIEVWVEWAHTEDQAESNIEGWNQSALVKN